MRSRAALPFFSDAGNLLIPMLHVESIVGSFLPNLPFGSSSWYGATSPIQLRSRMSAEWKAWINDWKWQQVSIQVLFRCYFPCACTPFWDSRWGNKCSKISSGSWAGRRFITWQKWWNWRKVAVNQDPVKSWQNQIAQKVCKTDRWACALGLQGELLLKKYNRLAQVPDARVLTVWMKRLANQAWPWRSHSMKAQRKNFEALIDLIDEYPEWFYLLDDKLLINPATISYHDLAARAVAKEKIFLMYSEQLCLIRFSTLFTQVGLKRRPFCWLLFGQEIMKNSRLWQPIINGEKVGRKMGNTGIQRVNNDIINNFNCLPKITEDFPDKNQKGSKVRVIEALEMDSWSTPCYWRRRFWWKMVFAQSNLIRRQS